MPEAENTGKLPDPVVEEKKTDPSEEMFGGKKFSELDPETQTKVKELREENKAKRLAYDNLAKELADIKAAQDAKDQEAKAAAEKALQEQGNYQKLYEAAQPQLQELGDVKKRNNELESFIKEALEAKVKAIPDSKRSLVDALPKMDNLTLLKWLQANEKLLAMPQAPNLDPGSSVNGGKVDDPSALAAMHVDYQRRF